MTPNFCIKNININEVGFNNIDLFFKFKDSCERIEIKNAVVCFNWDIYIVKLVKNL